MEGDEIRWEVECVWSYPLGVLLLRRIASRREDCPSLVPCLSLSFSRGGCAWRGLLTRTKEGEARRDDKKEQASLTEIKTKKEATPRLRPGPPFQLLYCCCCCCYCCCCYCCYSSCYLIVSIQFLLLFRSMHPSLLRPPPLPLKLLYTNILYTPPPLPPSLPHSLLYEGPAA